MKEVTCSKLSHSYSLRTELETVGLLGKRAIICEVLVDLETAWRLILPEDTRILGAEN